jgi:arylsulfatase A-like enzyme
MPYATSRRDFLTAGALTALPLRAQNRRPNVVLIVADDLGYGDTSAYGCPDIRTPHIDSIGRAGVKFTQFYANAPECSPTRTALLTGRYQHRVGGLECAIGVGDQGRYDEAIWLQKRGDLGLPAYETTIGQVLRTAGYATGCFGKWHLGYPEKFWPEKHGFDESFGVIGGNADYFTHVEQEGKPAIYRNGDYVKEPGYVTDLIANEAIGWLRRQKEKPFFLYLPFTAPHTPIQDPDGFDPKLGNAPVRQGHRPTFAKMVERMDARIGDVLQALTEMKAADNTLVIFVSDNGGDANGRNLPLRGRKSSLFEGGIRVPFMARMPGVFPQGKLAAQVAATMDVMPTILAATGVQPPRGRSFDGTNLLPVMTGKEADSERTLFWRFRRGDRTLKAVRHGVEKLVISPEGEYLFDIGRDPGEADNLISTAPQYAVRLKKQLAEWEREVAAPRLKAFKAASTP